MFRETKTLIVVYKDEIALNQLKKMVETKDDKENEIVGVTDGSVKIISWNEKVWIDNKKAGNITNKVLFIGDVKGIRNLVPVIDIKFDSFGVRYGWAGNQAVVIADPNELGNREKYSAFLEELGNLPVPHIIKDANSKVFTKMEKDISAAIEQNQDKEEADSSDKKIKGLIPGLVDNIQDGFEAFGNVAGKMGKDFAIFAQDLFRDKNMVKQQMLFYGVYKLYYDHLEEFLNN